MQLWLGVDEIFHVDLNMTQYTLLNGSSYTPLPNKLSSKKTIINLKNFDNKCFMWSVLTALHPVEQRKSPIRLHHYQQYEDELNFYGIEFPVTLHKIGKSEWQNNISINVFGFEDVLFPIYVTKEHFDTHVNLLLYSQETTRHYSVIDEPGRNLRRTRNKIAQQNIRNVGIVTFYLI